MLDAPPSTVFWDVCGLGESDIVQVEMYIEIFTSL